MTHCSSHIQGVHASVLTQYDDRGWRATFYTTGMEHSPTSAICTSLERTPWHATQRAACGVVRFTALMVKSWLPQLPRDHQGDGEREEVRLHGVQLLPGHGPQT